MAVMPYSIMRSWVSASSFSLLVKVDGSESGCIHDGRAAAEVSLRSGNLVESAMPRASAAGPGRGPWASARDERALQADQMFNRGGMAGVWWDGSPIANWA